MTPRDRLTDHGGMDRVGFDFPFDMELLGGSAFWVLNAEAAEFVLDFRSANPDFMQFFESVQIPDELFFQTVLGNSPLRSHLNSGTAHYTDWSRHPKPAILTVADLPDMLESGALFARKFDTEVDAAVLDRLDELAWPLFLELLPAEDSDCGDRECCGPGERPEHA